MIHRNGGVLVKRLTRWQLTGVDSKKARSISDYWLQVGLKVDLVMIGRIIGRKGGKMATKTARKQARNVLNVAKYLSFYHCYLILCDVKKWGKAHPQYPVWIH